MSLRKPFLFFLILLLTGLTACTPATPAPTAVPPTPAPALTLAVSPTVVPPTPAPPTLTLEPTITPQPTATLTASPTLTPIPPLAAQSFNSWCIPKDNAMLARAADNPSIMPEGAKPGVEKEGAISLITPALSCTFTVTFNQKLPEGAVIQVIDTKNYPWLVGDLIAAPQDPNTGYAVFSHTYLTDPPYWTVRYPVRVVLADGSQLWSNTVDMNRGWVKVCWDGTLANVFTLYCKKQQDLHPWDPAYTPPPPQQP